MVPISSEAVDADMRIPWLLMSSLARPLRNGPYAVGNAAIGLLQHADARYQAVATSPYLGANLLLREQTQTGAIGSVRLAGLASK
jgi:hypothetical protein